MRHDGLVISRTGTDVDAVPFLPDRSGAAKAIASYLHGLLASHLIPNLIEQKI
jgi:hypothetical protein